MYDCRREALDHSDGEGERYFLQQDGEDLNYAQFIDALIADDSFREFLSKLLAESPYRALRWECRPVTAASVTQPFEFVVLNAPDLDRPADRTTFADLFERMPPSGVGRFPNLGHDAIMIVPGPGDNAAYSHLAAFLRHAPEMQQHALWAEVGSAAQSRIGSAPMWLSTAGGGVAWLHVRLDDRPKYYAHMPYRTIA